MEVLRQYKSDLCRWLAHDPIRIMDKADNILTVKEYKTVMAACEGDKICSLLDIILGKKEEIGEEFLQILKDEQVRYPELGKLFNTSSPGWCHLSVCADSGSHVTAPMISSLNANSLSISMNTAYGGLKDQDLSKSTDNSTPQVAGQGPLPMVNSGVSSVIRASDGSSAFAPILTNSVIRRDVTLSFNVTGSSPVKASGSAKHVELAGGPVIQDKLEFLKKNFGKLVERVRNVDLIVDELISKDISREMAANVSVQKTSQAKMRELLFNTTSTGLAEAVFSALSTHQEDVMLDLLRT